MSSTGLPDAIETLFNSAYPALAADLADLDYGSLDPSGRVCWDLGALDQPLCGR